MFAWMMLLIAGICEILWGIGLKLSDGFKKPIPTVVMIVFANLSFYFLTLAVRQLPLGIAYAIWCGIGAVGIILVGHFLYNEYLNIFQLLFIVLILIGIVGIKVSSG